MIQSIDGDSSTVKPTVKVYIYCRVSSLEQVNGYGLKRQQDTVKAFLEDFKVRDELGYDIDRENFEVLEDAGKSAYHGYNFTKGQLGIFRDKVLNKEITSGLFLIENIDRFCRQKEYFAMQEFNHLIIAGIDILEAETGEIFSTKIDGSLTKLSVSISRAYSESKRKSNISKKSWKNRKSKSLEKGIAINNNTPEWLMLSEDKKEYVIIKDKVEILNDMFKSYVDGYGATAIINRLNENKIFLNTTGWSTNKFYHVLRNRRLIGFLGEERHYPEVIDPVLFEQAQTLLNSKGRQRKKSGTMMRSMFNGIAKCKFCGNGMIVQSMSSSQLYLRCIANRTKTTKCTESKLIRYAEAERLLLEHVRNVDWASLKSESTPDLKELNALKVKASIIDSKIDEALKELAKADDDLVLVLTRVINNRRSELRTIEEKIASLESNVEVPDVSIIANINDIQNQDNLELRQKVYTLLSKTISTITCARHDLLETMYIFEINYIGTDQRHVIYCNKTIEKVVSIYIKTNDGITTYHTSSFSIEVSKDLLTLNIPETVNLDDYIILKNYVDLNNIDGNLSQWMNEQFDEVVRQTSGR